MVAVKEANPDACPFSIWHGVNVHQQISKFSDGKSDLELAKRENECHSRAQFLEERTNFGFEKPVFNLAAS
jgi:hypothetical protein